MLHCTTTRPRRCRHPLIRGANMSDYLVKASSNATLRSVLKSVGVPTPVTLERAQGPYQQRFLEGQKVLVGASAGSTALTQVDAALESTGATVEHANTPQPADDEKFDALVFDATGMQGVADLKSLY